MADVLFERKLGINGNSISINIPPELLTFLNVKEGDDLILTAQQKKKGKFIALWRKGK